MCGVPDRRGEDVAVFVPLFLLDVAPTVEFGLGEKPRHREGAAVDDASDEHNVEQGADLIRVRIMVRIRVRVRIRIRIRVRVRARARARLGLGLKLGLGLGLGLGP